MFQLFQSYVVVSGFMLQVVFGCFMCSTNMLQVRVLNVSYVFKRILHSNVFYVANVSCCMAGGEPRASGLGARHAEGPANEAAGGHGQWCCGRGALGPCPSLAAHPGS
jgi:hypothetical protein